MRMILLLSLSCLLWPCSSHAQATQNAGQLAALQTSPWRAQFVSSRIEALRKQVASGGFNAEAFWKEIAGIGTPLIEPSKPGDKHQLITFLWRGKPDTRNVVVAWQPFVHLRPADYFMTHLSGTDVWYLSMRVPSGARFAYSFVPNVPTDGPGLDAGIERTPSQADPLNKLRYMFGQSRVELPGAAPQTWATRKAGTPTGRLEVQTITSERFASQMQVAVYMPPRYRADGPPNALLVMFDGVSYRETIPGPTTLDNLIEASQIPNVVAVFVSNRGPSTRMDDYIYGPLKGDGRIEGFLASELVPWVREHYNVTRDPRLTVIGGSSAGAFAATYAALRLPELFGNVLSQSGSFGSSLEGYAQANERLRHGNPAVRHEIGDDHIIEELEDQALLENNWMARQFIKSPTLPLKFYLDIGLFEVSQLPNSASPLETTRALRDVLLAKGYDVHYNLSISGHDYLNWRGTFADGLIALLGTK